MRIDELPKYIRESVVLDDNDKYLLTQIEQIPSVMEVEDFALNATILELTNAFIGDETTRNIHLQQLAKEYLRNKDIVAAWKVILQ